MKKKHKLIVGAFALTSIIGIAFLTSDILNPIKPTQDISSTLSISPKEGSFPIDGTFDISVNIDSKQSINAAEATINFDPDTLEVVNISKDKSIFNLWIQEPTFSNASSSIQFSGGIIPNGYQGSGELFIITFQPKKTGSTNLTFSNASVLANDGKGTETLKNTVNGSYTIKHAESALDFNNDGKIDIKDISILLTHWGNSSSSKYNAKYDLNKDGRIDLIDISIMLSRLR